MIAGIIAWLEDSQDKTFKIFAGRLSLEEAEELINTYCEEDNVTKKTTATSKPMVGLW